MLLASDSASPTKARGWPKWPCISFQVCSQIPTQPRAPSLTVSSPTEFRFFPHSLYPKDNPNFILCMLQRVLTWLRPGCLLPWSWIARNTENSLQDISKSCVSASRLTRNPQVPHGPSRSGARNRRGCLQVSRVRVAALYSPLGSRAIAGQRAGPPLPASSSRGLCLSVCLSACLTVCLPARPGPSIDALRRNRFPSFSLLRVRVHAGNLATLGETRAGSCVHGQPGTFREPARAGGGPGRAEGSAAAGNSFRASSRRPPRAANTATGRHNKDAVCFRASSRRPPRAANKANGRHNKDAVRFRASSRRHSTFRPSRVGMASRRTVRAFLRD